MLVSYVTPADVNVASFRLRMAIIAAQLEKAGHETTAGVFPIASADVCVFAKHFNPQDPKIAEVQKKRGSLIVYDVCDDYFRDEELGPHYRAMCEIADRITTCSPYLARRVFEETGKIAIPITDPYEFPEVPPQRTDTTRLLWFGHQTNLKSLFDVADQLGPRPLLVVSKQVTDKIVPYSPGNLLQAFAQSDVVIIPRPKDGTSANRLVESVRQGKYVVAGDECEAYKGYGMWLGGIKEGLEWFESHRDEAYQAVIEGQKIVAEKHSPEAVAKEWESVFASADGR